MSQEFFNRMAKLTVFQTKRTVDSSGNSVITQFDTNGTQFRSQMEDGSAGYRIKFNVVKVSAPVPIGNMSTIQIYNLGADSRALLSSQDNIIVLQAGYGENLGVIFRGNINWTKTQKEGADYITTINAIDGQFAIQNATVNQSFGAGVSLKTIVSSLVSALKGSGVTTKKITGIPNVNYNQGIVLTGKAVDQLHQVCEKENLHFHIEEGGVIILPYGSNLGTPAIVLSSDTGLIGIPELRGVGLASPLLNGSVAGSQTNYIKKSSLISFQSLLNPEISMFKPIVISSLFINGVFNVLRVTFSGDTWGPEWYVNGECA